jgi:hypothetical protein
MPNSSPIACSLTATELPERLAEMARLGREALVSVSAEPQRAELRFAAEREVRERVQAIAAAEAQCCAFLTLSVGDEADAVVLTIEAPENAEPVLADLVEAFACGPEQVRAADSDRRAS